MFQTVDTDFSPGDVNMNAGKEVSHESFRPLTRISLLVTTATSEPTATLTPSFRPLTRISLLVTPFVVRKPIYQYRRFQTVDTDFSPGDQGKS